jgi:lipopolysaccharide biosynthesis glycosyltransferase
MHLKVVYSCNNGYVMQTGISIISLLENNKAIGEITVIIVSYNISASNISTLKKKCEDYGRKFQLVNFSDIAYDLELSSTGRHIATVYTKIFFSRIEGLDKVFYIDSDTIVNSSLEELWDINLDGYYMGMVKTYTGSAAKTALKMSPDSSFFNDGVALCNVDYCRRNNLIEKCKRVIKEFSGNPPVLSEGVLNKVCEEQILAISPRYNMMAGLYHLIGLNPGYAAEHLGYSEKELIESYKHPVVIHFLSGFYNRPWNKGCKHPLRGEYYKYKCISQWENEPLMNAPLSLKLRALGMLLNLLGPYNFDKLKRFIKH